MRERCDVVDSKYATDSGHYVTEQGFIHDKNLQFAINMLNSGNHQSDHGIIASRS